MNNKIKKGSVLAYSLIILAMMVAIVASIAGTTVMGKKDASSTEFSVQALQTADSGIKLVANKIKTNGSSKMNLLAPALGSAGVVCDSNGDITDINTTDSGNGKFILSFYKADGTTKLNCYSTTDPISSIRIVQSRGVYKDTARDLSLTLPDPCDNKTTFDDRRPPIPHPPAPIPPANEDKVYPITAIGNQCWMQENLRTAYLPDGSAQLPLNSNGKPGRYCYNGTGHNDTTCTETRTSNGIAMIYGGLYTSVVALNGHSLVRPDDAGEGPQGICPDGWHIPTYLEMKTLIDTLGPSAGTLLSVNASHAASATSFNGILAGWSDNGPTDGNRDGYGYWWNAADAWNLSALPSVCPSYFLMDVNGMVNNGNGSFACSGMPLRGQSVRCLKNQT